MSQEPIRSETYEQSPCTNCEHGQMCAYRATYEKFLSCRDKIMCKTGAGSEDAENLEEGVANVIISHRFVDGPALADIYKRIFGVAGGGIHACNGNPSLCHCKRWYTRAGCLPHGSILFREFNPTVPNYCATVDHPRAYSWSLANWTPDCRQCSLKYVRDDPSMIRTIGGTGFSEFDHLEWQVPLGIRVSPSDISSSKVPAGYERVPDQAYVTVSENYQTIEVLWRYNPKENVNDKKEPVNVTVQEGGVTTDWLMSRNEDRACYIYTDCCAFGDEIQTPFEPDGTPRINPHVIMEFQGSSGNLIREHDQTLQLVGERISYSEPELGVTVRTADPTSAITGVAFKGKRWECWQPKPGDTGVAYPLYTRDTGMVHITVPPGKRLAIELIKAVNPTYMKLNTLTNEPEMEFYYSRKLIEVSYLDPGIVCQPLDGPQNEALGVNGGMVTKKTWQYTIQFTIKDENFYIPIRLEPDVDDPSTLPMVQLIGLRENYVHLNKFGLYPITTNGHFLTWNDEIPYNPIVMTPLEAYEMEFICWRQHMSCIAAGPIGVADGLTEQDMESVKPETTHIYAGYPGYGKPESSRVYQKLLYHFDPASYYMEFMGNAYDLGHHLDDCKRVPLSIPEKEIMLIGDDTADSEVKPQNDICDCIHIDLEYTGEKEPLEMLVDAIQTIMERTSQEPYMMAIYDFSDTRWVHERKACFPPTWNMFHMGTEHAYLASIAEEGSEPDRFSLSNYIIFHSADGIVESLIGVDNADLVLCVAPYQSSGVVGSPNYAIIPIHCTIKPKPLKVEVSYMGTRGEGDFVINDIRTEGFGPIDEAGELEVKYDWDHDEFYLDGNDAWLYTVEELTFVEEIPIDIQYVRVEDSGVLHDERILMLRHKATKMTLEIAEFSTLKRISIADKGGTAVPYIHSPDHGIIAEGTTNVIGSGIVQVNPGTDEIPWQLFFNIEDPVNIMVYVTESNEDPTKQCARCKGYVKCDPYSEWLEWVPSCKKYTPMN